MAKRGRKAKAQRAAPAADPAPAPDPAPDPAPSSPGAWANALIAAFLLFQIAMPLRYYLGGRGYDERFSWRMFSSVRMQRCDVRVQDVTTAGDERRVDLERELQVAWIGMLDRYRPQVVEKFLSRRCASEGVREARYERMCKDTDGSELPRLQVALDCRTQHMQRSEGGS